MQVIFDKYLREKKYDFIRNKVENELREHLIYLEEEFIQYTKVIEFKDSATFKVNIDAKCNVIENRISLNFDQWANYVTNKVDRNLNNIELKKKWIFQSLHHELQHNFNHYEYSDFRTQIDNVNINSTMRTLTWMLIDELIATYEAHKAWSLGANVYNHFLYLMNNNMIEPSGDDNRLDALIEIVPILSFSLGEYYAEKENIDREDSTKLIDFIDKYIGHNIICSLELHLNEQQFNQDLIELTLSIIHKLSNLIHVDHDFLELIDHNDIELYMKSK